MKQIIQVKPLLDYKLWLKFSDGTEGEVDLSHLNGKGVFKKWNDYQFFKSVKVGKSGDLFWDENIGLCPDSLYLKVTNKTPSDLFPSLSEEFVDA